MRRDDLALLIPLDIQRAFNMQFQARALFFGANGSTMKVTYRSIQNVQVKEHGHWIFKQVSLEIQTYTEERGLTTITFTN